MALVESNTFGIGEKASDFKLLDTASGKVRSLSDLKGKNGTVIFFICNHCPYVVHVNEGLISLANDYKELGISFIAISSNNIETHPEDGPELMKERAIELGYPFPYLYDEDQNVAKNYKAACTPDFYLFDDMLEAIYHGQLDDSRPGNNIPVTGSDMRNAIDRLLNNEEPIENPKPSIGCSIKWK